LDGLKDVDWDKLMSIPKEYWQKDIKETKEWLDGQLGDDLPADIRAVIQELEKRFE